MGAIETLLVEFHRVNSLFSFHPKALVRKGWLHVWLRVYHRETFLGLTIVGVYDAVEEVVRLAHSSHLCHQTLVQVGCVEGVGECGWSE